MMYYYNMVDYVLFVLVIAVINKLSTSIAVTPVAVAVITIVATPGLHNKIPAYKIFARGWIAQEPFCS